MKKYGFKLLTVSAILLLASCTASFKNLPEQKNVANWYKNAELYLVIRSSKKPVNKRYLNQKRDSKQYPRCIELNNYWCIKGAHRWVGAIAKDDDGHSIFKNPIHAASATTYLLRQYDRENLKTANQIMSKYAPASDCRGSSRGRNPDGTCRLEQFPERYAKFIAKELGHINSSGEGDMYADLRLFNFFGQPSKKMSKMLQLIAIFEVGLIPRDELVEKGIKRFRGACRSNCF